MSEREIPPNTKESWFRRNLISKFDDGKNFKTLDDKPYTNNEDMDIEQAISYALDGDAVLFLGSGFSKGAYREDGSEFETARPLAHKLLAECNFKEEDFIDDLGKVAEIYQELRSENELVDFLQKEFSAVKVNDSHNIIASIKWKRIYTTNYDNVIELAYQNNNKLLRSVSLSQKLSDFKDKSNLCIHLNGRVDGLTIQKLNGEFKLTDRSYLTEDFRKSEWLSLLKTDFLTAKTIFFVGYSMQYDIDIQRLCFSIEDMSRKTFFIMSENESKISQLLVKKYGVPCTIGSDGLSTKIVKIKKTHVSPATRLNTCLCFKKCSLPKTPERILDSDVIKLLTKGEYSSDKLYYSSVFPEEFKYCFRRTKLDKAIEAIENGEKNVLIHASLGNGKSIFIDALSSLLTHKGYEVYRFYRYMATFAEEVEYLCQKSDNVVLIFEDYSGCIENLNIFKQHRSGQILVTSERSFVNEANYDNIFNLFGEFLSFDLNILDDNEIAALISLLDNYGFWSYMSSKSIVKKKEFIRNTCCGHIRNVILRILKSPTIIKRFQDIVNAVRQKEGYYEAIIFMLVASVSQVNLGVDDLAEALNISQVNSPRFRKNPIVREFVSFEDNVVLPKSSLLSKTLLEQIFDTDIVVDVLINIMQRLNDYGTGKVAKQIVRRLMTYTNVQQILNDNDPNHKYNLLRYYERIKDLPSCRTNPHFWLQYAIVMLSERNYPQAKLYFEAAYSFGSEIVGFDSYQIDNHFARYILENEVMSGSKETCMEAFRNAHAILLDPKHKVEVRYYPYKVARWYYSFYEKFYKGLQKHEQVEFKSSCEAMLSRLEWYISTSEIGFKSRDVYAAKTGIEKILAETSSLA